MFNGAESHKAQWKYTLFGKERESLEWERERSERRKFA
jgi:hypothetical protein